MAKSRQSSLAKDRRAQPAELIDGAVKSAGRVLDVLEFLGHWDHKKTHSDIAEALNIPKSSLTPLLQTMLRRGFLEYKPDSKSYVLGPVIKALASIRRDGHDLITIANALLPKLADRIQETCALNVLKGDKVEVVAAAIANRRLLSVMKVGDTAPLYATSAGKALLASLPNDMQEEYFSGVRFESFTPKTIMSVDRLREDLARVKRSGFAFVFEEFTPGIAGIARAVLNKKGYPLAAVNIALPASRYDETVRQDCLSALSDFITALTGGAPHFNP